jgi:putative ABC transport system permease protein
VSPALILRLLLRGWRGGRGRIAVFVACLALGVAAVVAVRGLSGGIDRGVRAAAKELLAADLAVESRRPLPPDLDRHLARWRPVARADVRELTTMASIASEPEAMPAGDGRAPRTSLMVELKAVGAGYPFYGQLVTQPALGPAPLGADQALIAPEAAKALGLAPGGTLLLGGARFTVVAVVESEPDRLFAGLSLGPRVFLSLAGLERSGLERFGSRITRRALFRLPPGAGRDAAAAAEARLKTALAGSPEVRVRSYLEARPDVRAAVGRLDRFGGLVALVSLLVGGIGVAETVRSWMRSRVGTIAVLRALGFRPRDVLVLFGLEALALGVLGSVLGALLGIACEAALPALLGELVPHLEVRLLEPRALALGLALGVAVALVFSLEPLLEARRIPPLAALRREVEPPPVGRVARALVVLVVVAAVWLMAALEARSLIAGGIFTAVLGTAALLLLGAGRVLLGVAARARRIAGLTLRYGLVALARPGAGTLGSVVAIGLGVLVVLALTLVERRLAGELGGGMPAAAPTAFLVDIQTDQWAGLRAVLEEEGATGIDSVPVVMARLAAIDRRPVATIAREEGEDGERGRGALTREQRLTYLDRLPAGNEVVAGALWSRQDAAEVSLEEGFARALGVGLGALLTFDVQGVAVDLVVTSLRKVDWATYGINFFLVAEPGPLDRAPQWRLATARLPREREGAIQDRLAAAYPNVTLVKTREVLERVAGILARLGLAVRVLGGFTVVVGLVVLGGAVAAGAARRSREAALLKTLGMTRGEVARVFAVEYAAVGLAAGLVGAAGGSALAWAFTRQALDLPGRLDPLAAALAVLASGALAVLAGLAASRRALARRPMEVLRGE